MPSLQQYRQALGRSLDDLGVYTVASATGGTAVVSALVDGTTNASTRLYDGRFAYISAGFGIGSINRVKPGGFAPSTGTLTLQRAWDTAPQAGDTLELTGLFPATPGQGEDDDYRTLIHRGLGRLLVEDYLDLTTVADQYSYSLATYAAWLDRPTRFLGVLDPPRATGLPRRESWRRARLKVDGPTPTLEFLDRPYPTSGATFQLAVLRPANTLISGAESTVGLVADTDTAIPSVEEVVTAARVFAFEALLTRSKGRPSGEWSGQYEKALEQARGLARWDRSQDAAPAPTERGAA